MSLLIDLAEVSICLSAAFGKSVAGRLENLVDLPSPDELTIHSNRLQIEYLLVSQAWVFETVRVMASIAEIDMLWPRGVLLFVAIASIAGAFSTVTLTGAGYVEKSPAWRFWDGLGPVVIMVIRMVVVFLWLS